MTGSKNTPKAPAGLDGVSAAETSLSLVDGAASELLYRGIQVHEFIGRSSFEEAAFFLWRGKLPSRSELAAFKSQLSAARSAGPAVFELISKLPKNTHPMTVLRTLVSFLAVDDPEADVFDAEASRRQALLLTAKLPVIIAAFHRHREGKAPVPPDPSLSHAADFLSMMHGKAPEKEMVEALDAYLILLADHGLNASTFSARVTVATQSDLYSAVTSAIGTLKGELHGGANQRSMEMILDIGTPERAEAYILDLLKQKKKVMGFGHRIYKNRDPRADAFRKLARAVCERTGNSKFLDISEIVEKVMWETKGIPCNVDFYSASVLYSLGFPVDFFTTVFAASRIAGWTAHVIEQQLNNRLIRPAADYTGPVNQHYVPLEER